MPYEGYYGGPVERTPEEEAAIRLEKEQLNDLITALRDSKDIYDTDVSTLSSALTVIDTSSPIVSEMNNYLSGLLSDTTNHDDYSNFIASLVCLSSSY